MENKNKPTDKIQAWIILPWIGKIAIIYREEAQKKVAVKFQKHDILFYISPWIVPKK
jgi:hypothetical protein